MTTTMTPDDGSAAAAAPTGTDPIPRGTDPAAHDADPPPPDSFLVPLRTVSPGAPLHWLRQGWRDFAAAPGVGLFYGAWFTCMGWALLYLFRHAPAYVLALAAGFVLVSPFLCLGMYDASRTLARGRRPRLGATLFAWRTRSGTMAVFGVVLLILEMLWARASLVVFALSFDGMPDFKGSLLALLDPQNLEFIVAWFVLGGLFATVIYAVSVVSMPMILDRHTDAITAGLTSIRLCLAQPGAMFLWAALIVLLVVLAMLPGFAGLLVVAPVLGHASWHAYRATVGE